jgi:hypothetical protein
VDGVLALAVTAVSLGALLATSRDYAMVWDEGHTVGRERVLAGWFARLAAAPGADARAELFSRNELERSWPFSREEPDGHPPFYALLGLAGWHATRHWLDPLTAYRFGPMALASVTMGVLFFHLARRYGRLAAATAIGCALSMPRIFSHAHYAHYDMPVSCLWVLSQLAFAAALRSRWWAVPFGVLTGLAAGTKFTGWFAPVAPLLWTAVAEGPAIVRRLFSAPWSVVSKAPLRGVPALAIGLPVAALVLVAIQPPWWADPVAGVRRFVVSNLTRSETKPIPTLYLGQIYEFSLPWHNTLVLTAVTVPMVTLALGALGAAYGLGRGRSDPEGLLWALSCAVLMIVRALPSAPGHDGIRLFLPSILSLAVLAGLGAAALAQALRARGLGWIAVVAAVAAFGEGTLGVVQLYPYTLSYYNAALGGLRGAERSGFELTYYWDTLGSEFLGWVRNRDRTVPGRLELRFPTELVTIRYLREWGVMPPDVWVVPYEPATRPDYVLQRRRGVYHPSDWWLERHGTPEFSVQRQGVDLLRVYPGDETLRAYHATKDIPMPDHLRK